MIVSDILVGWTFLPEDWEINEYRALAKANGHEIWMRRGCLHIARERAAAHQVRTSKFTMIEGVDAIALDVDDFNKAFLGENFCSMAQAIIEVRKKREKKAITPHSCYWLETRMSH